jgi:Mg2+-importing ATPase
MATSANFGNMFSMAGASLFLPFLPLVPKQVLFTNLLTDFPEMAIASDNVDDEATAGPQHWDVGMVRRFMITFGLLSSVFDYLTFGAIVLVVGPHPAAFRTGWFVSRSSPRRWSCWSYGAGVRSAAVDPGVGWFKPRSSA